MIALWLVVLILASAHQRRCDKDNVLRENQTWETRIKNLANVRHRGTLWGDDEKIIWRKGKFWPMFPFWIMPKVHSSPLPSPLHGGHSIIGRERLKCRNSLSTEQRLTHAEKTQYQGSGAAKCPNFNVSLLCNFIITLFPHSYHSSFSVYQTISYQYLRLLHFTAFSIFSNAIVNILLLQMLQYYSSSKCNRTAK